MKKNWKIIIPALVIIAGLAGYGFYRNYQDKKLSDPLDRMTLKQAADSGEPFSEMKLLVQIKTPQGRADDANARLERGDVVLAKPADWQFSDTEKEIFLIIKVRLTPTLAQLIVQPLNKEAKPPLGGFASKSPEDQLPTKEQLKRRKFAVDLGKIGIGENDTQGREITDKVFEWEILIQK